MECTTNFIEVVKRHEAIYDTTHQDYKNIERKTKAWRNVAREMGITVEAAKRKWKNLRDSYTKYLRSFRVGTKTSRKYQYWAHADHMEFLRPFQGPGRSQSNSIKTDESGLIFYPSKDDDPGCDIGFEMVEKCYPDEPLSNEIIQKTIAYSTNEPKLCTSFDRKTASALRDMDATTMFFLSLAKSVKEMPLRKQTTVKMLCMKIVHDAEMEIDNSMSEVDSLTSSSIKMDPNQNECRNAEIQIAAKMDGQDCQQQPESSSEHFLYVMSPSRVEAMIDISSDDESPKASI